MYDRFFWRCILVDIDFTQPVLGRIAIFFLKACLGGLRAVPGTGPFSGKMETKGFFLRKRLTIFDLFEGLWSVGTRHCASTSPRKKLDMSPSSTGHGGQQIWESGHSTINIDQILIKTSCGLRVFNNSAFCLNQPVYDIQGASLRGRHTPPATLATLAQEGKIE